ncbi:hypothetical protein FPJ27_27130 [Burkholderia sp. MS455]|nr:hypothetical protein FPJ27_27130 [Burkholderia sp. MS455]
MEGSLVIESGHGAGKRRQTLMYFCVLCRIRAASYPFRHLAAVRRDIKTARLDARIAAHA